MKRCCGLRWTSSTSSPLAPSRTTITEAAARGGVGAPAWRSRSPVVGRFTRPTVAIRTDPLPSSAMTTETAIMKWICESCGFIYDPEEGDPDGGIPPDTAFADIPDTWFCPVCGARKKDFTPYDE